MSNDTTFETDDTTIDFEQVTAFGELDPAGTAGGAPEQLQVQLKDGSTVPVRGEAEVQGFVQALEAHLELEPDGES